MPRRAHPSRSLSAAVRAHFGLSQAELAAFIGVSRAHLGLAEAGTKTRGPAPDQRLQVLARQLPPPDGLGPPVRPPATFTSSAPPPSSRSAMNVLSVARCQLSVNW